MRASLTKLKTHSFGNSIVDSSSEMANEALESLQQILVQILQWGDDLTPPLVKQQIESIHVTALHLQLNLEHFPDEATLGEVANAAEAIIRSLFSAVNLLDCGLVESLGDIARALEAYWLERLVENNEVTSFDKDGVVEFDEYLTDYPIECSKSRSAPTSKDLVSLDDRDRIIDQLASSSTELPVLSIVGMAGIGKSALAKVIYDSITIVQRFDIRVWITISQDYSLESVVLDLLALMKIDREQVHQHSVRRDCEQVHRHLVGRRYLIVMDDVWSTQLWDDMRSVFPDNANGSRILFTTRLMDVAYHCRSSIHVMRLLDEQESWDLFQHEAFADQTCPLELQAAAKKIVLGCGGLPLSILNKANFLSKIDKTPKAWQQMANDVQMESISSLSYNFLPHHLRPCFLYMAAFPGDYEIHASELIRLWIAEGFLERSNEYKSLEQVGEAYLEDLMDINLVLVTNKKIDGKIKTCKLHSTVRDFCVRQAEQEKLLLPVMDYLPTPILRRHFLPKLLENHRRISASWYDLKDSVHSSCTHSIICMPQKGYKPKASVRNFTSLRVLHVLRRKDGSYWELGQVFDLIYLKYLASNIPTSIVPPSISKLQNLQTLIFYRHEVRLPMEIWRLRQLRHLIAFSFYPLPHPSEEAFPLNNLQTLYLAIDFVCSAKMVEMIPNITKLGICYSKEIHDEGHCLDNLSHLFSLEKLKLETRSLVWPSVKPLFPQSLKKLTLSGWRLPWSDMVIVARLPHLQILKLRNYAFDGECWETEEGGFAKLRLLLIDESNLQDLTTETDHFPRLQSLMLHHCPDLLEIPDDIGDIATLELIEIDDSNQSLLKSAKLIQKEQIENGNDELQVQAVHL